MTQEPDSIQTTGDAKAEPRVNAERDLKHLSRWFIWVSILVVFLVVVGGIVRLTGSGLSIPEWPIINGSLLPPISESDWEAVYKTYHSVIEGVEVDSIYHSAHPGIIPLGRFKQMFAFEYFHRSVAALLGIFFIILLIKVLRRKQVRAQYAARMWFAFALLIGQSVMGGIVVKYDLQAEFLAVHLGLAFAFFGLLFWTGLALNAPPIEKKNYYNRFLSRIAWTAVVAVYLQILSGGIVAGTKAGYSWNTWPKIGDYLIPPLNVLWRSYLPGLMNFIQNEILVQFIHRWWAFAALFVIFFLVFYTLRYHISRQARYAFRLVASLAVLQVILGILTLLLKVPAVLGVIHLAVGIILFANLLYITYELKNHEVSLS
jgi:cytochrome c oxidase assembly protein subunit 15